MDPDGSMSTVTGCAMEKWAMYQSDDDDDDVDMLNAMDEYPALSDLIEPDEEFDEYDVDMLECCSLHTR